MLRIPRVWRYTGDQGRTLHFMLEHPDGRQTRHYLTHENAMFALLAPYAEVRSAPEGDQRRETAVVTRVSVNDILEGRLPSAATGVRWEENRWTECREHLLDPAWRTDVAPSDEPVGVVLYGDVTCDAHREQRGT